MTLERYWSDGSRDKTFVWKRSRLSLDDPERPAYLTEQIIVKGTDVDSCLPTRDDPRWKPFSECPPR